MLKDWVKEMVDLFESQNANFPGDLEKKIAFVRFLQGRLNDEAGRNRPATGKELQQVAEDTWKKATGNG